MKSLIFLFLAICCLQTSFAQSKKKKHALLILELKARKESYDSLKYVFYVKLYEFEGGIKKTYKNQMSVFSKFEQEIAFLDESVREHQAQLAKLKAPFLPLKVIQLPNLDLKSDLGTFDPVYAEIDKKLVPDKKIKVQNAFLEKRIRDFDSIFRLNKQTVCDLSAFEADLKHSYDDLLEKQKVYDEYLNELKKENKQLINQLNTLFDEYLKNGKKGFPKEYDAVFSTGRIGDNQLLMREEPAYYCLEKEDAEFPGGIENLKYYVGKNYKIPSIALELGLEGKGWVRFTILENGSVADVKVIRGITDCPECDREAIRIIKQMPLWKPAISNGNPVKTTYNMPFEIKLN